MTNAVLSALCDELTIWCAAEGLEPMAAEDLLCVVEGEGPAHEAAPLRRERAAWLREFIDRWDEAEERAAELVYDQKAVEPPNCRCGVTRHTE